jgi:hypothetical protein
MRGVFEIIIGRRVSANAPEKILPASPSVDLPRALSSREKGAPVTELLLFETAKEILGEVFNTTPLEVEEMIRIRMMDQKNAM